MYGNCQSARSQKFYFWNNIELCPPLYFDKLMLKEKSDLWSQIYLKFMLHQSGVCQKQEFKVSEDLKFEALWRLDLLAEPRLKFKFLKYYEQQIFLIVFKYYQVFFKYYQQQMNEKLFLQKSC